MPTNTHATMLSAFPAPVHRHSSLRGSKLPCPWVLLLLPPPLQEEANAAALAALPACRNDGACVVAYVSQRVVQPHPLFTRPVGPSAAVRAAVLHAPVPTSALPSPSSRLPHLLSLLLPPSLNPSPTPLPPHSTWPTLRACPRPRSTNCSLPRGRSRLGLTGRPRARWSRSGRAA